MVRDPVCRMEVDERNAEFMTHIGHDTFYFCSKVCQDSFELDSGIQHNDPEKKWWQKILKEPKTPPYRCQ
ncbi:MAG: YHS domain-containing protein [Deltaproteobacteria bacterium]|nr:YHS domain-containing protein [Deltaproteobacteria bacterium]